MREKLSSDESRKKKDFLLLDTDKTEYLKLEDGNTLSVRQQHWI